MFSNPRNSRKTIRLARAVYREGYAFLITIATEDRHPWFGLHPKLTHRATKILIELARARETSLYAWSFMPDHVHLLIQDDDVVEFARLVKGTVVPEARSIESTRGLWQRSFHDHALRKDEDLRETAVYVWTNAVEARLAKEAWHYPWAGSLVWPNWRELLRDGLF